MTDPVFSLTADDGTMYKLTLAKVTADAGTPDPEKPADPANPPADGSDNTGDTGTPAPPSEPAQPDEPVMRPNGITVQVGDTIEFNDPNPGQSYIDESYGVLSPQGGHSWTPIFTATKPGTGKVSQWKDGGGKHSAHITVVAADGSKPKTYSAEGVADTKPSTDTQPPAANPNPPAKGDSGNDAQPAEGPRLKRVIRPSSGKPCRVKAVVSNGLTGTFEQAIDPGTKVRLANKAGPSEITVIHSTGGLIGVQASLINTAHDVQCHLTITDPDGNVLFDHDTTLFTNAGNRPWRYKPIKLKPRDQIDMSLLPTLDLSLDGVSQHDWLASLVGKKDRKGNLLLGPNGTGMYQQGMPDTGPHGGIGPTTTHDAPAIINLLAGRAYDDPLFVKNMEVVESAANSFAVFPFHRDDPATLKPLSIVDYPKASSLWVHIGGRGNPITVNPSSHNPVNTGQARAHGPAFCAFAAMIIDDEYYAEELAQWANEQSLGQNEAYRGYDKGWVANAHMQLRGCAWALRTVGIAAKICTGYEAYFQAWIDHTLAHVNHLTPYDSEHAPIWLHDLGDSNRNMAIYSNFMGWFWQGTLGYMVQMGYEGYRKPLSYYGQLVVQAVNCRDYPAATHYHLWARPDKAGKQPVVADYQAMLVETAKHESGLRKAMSLADPTSQAYINALVYNAPAYQAGGFEGHQTQASGFVANMQYALAMAAKHQLPGADSAWARFETVGRPQLVASMNKHNEAQFAVVP